MPIPLKKFIVMFGVAFFFALPAEAQFPVVDAEQVQGWLTGRQKVVLVDVRSADEYREGHIPGAILMPAERVFDERSRLPKDKSTTLIFYCRGIG